MNKRANPIFLLVGIFFSLVAGIIMVKMLRFNQFDRNPSLFFRRQPSIDILPQGANSAMQTEGASAENANGQWMNFAGLDLLSEKVSLTFTNRCKPNEIVEIPPMDILAWYPAIFEDGTFGIGKDLAVAWEHLGYEGLWIHSGWDFWQERSPATDLQYFLETNEVNEVLPLKSMETKLTECLLGSDVELRAQEASRQGWVSAVVRVPSEEVEELSRHTMDLVPYLAGAYPESGFAELDPNALLIYFCGRAALDEITNTNADYWTQTRFIIAIEPVE